MSHLLDSLTDTRGMSSHWRHYHQHFSVGEGGRFHVEGIEGFTPLVRWKAPFHYGLQRYFLKFGQELPDFARYLRLMREIGARWRAQLDLGMIRQALTLAQVRTRIPVSDGMHMVIGDGFGGLGALILAADPRSRVLYVNLSKSLLLDLHFCRLAHPDVRMALARDEKEMIEAVADPHVRVIALMAGDSNLLSLAQISVAYNIASMQEMDLSVIQDYFHFMRRCAQPVYFYCCNRLEKRLPDGSIIRFHEYPWSVGDQILLDELCPWHQQYYTLRPPFFHPYDGPLQHRLVRLEKEENTEENGIPMGPLHGHGVQ